MRLCVLFILCIGCGCRAITTSQLDQDRFFGMLISRLDTLRDMRDRERLQADKLLNRLDAHTRDYEEVVKTYRELQANAGRVLEAMKSVSEAQEENLREIIGWSGGVGGVALLGSGLYHRKKNGHGNGKRAAPTE